MEGQDIKVLLLNIKKNIVKVESGQSDKNTLKEIERDFLDVLELIKLFMISRRDSYYGYFMMNMKFKVDFGYDGLAGILLNHYPPVFVSNPLVLCKITLQEIIYTVCHEIEHVILNHPAEMVKINPNNDDATHLKLNYAADASVNDRLDDEIRQGCKFMVTPKFIVNSKAFKEIFGLSKVARLENFIYYYNLIKDKDVDEDDPQYTMQKYKDECQSSSPSDKIGEAESKDSQGDANQNNTSSGEGESSDEEENSQIINSDNVTGANDHCWGDDGEEYEDIFANTKEFINQSFNMMNEETRGLMPDSFISQVKKINEPPKINWKSILKKYIGTISADQIHTRRRLNRRQPDRFDLSGKMNDKVLKIVVAIDTSGSMTDRQVELIFNELFAILAKRKYIITVIECDAAIQRIYKVKKPSDVQLNVLGRGGTSYKPVIKYINENREYRDALLIYFTDGFGDEAIPKPLTYRNLWVITDGTPDQLSLAEPYGIVISMEEKDE